MRVLIDADLICYRCAASAENEPEEAALLRADASVQDILTATNADEYKLYITGQGNFRYTINPEYKANRRDVPKPQWLNSIKEYLITQWNAEVVNGIEADDALAVDQNSNTVIASIDKDMLQVEGLHYNFVKKEFTVIDKVSGLHNFYTQLILGDRVDNIFGYDGKARNTIPKFLQPVIDDLRSLVNEFEMFQLLKELYEANNNEDKLLINGQCLWLCRENREERWKFPTLEKENDPNPPI